MGTNRRMATYFLGIDVSKRSNVCCLVAPQGEHLIGPTVANTLTGSQELAAWPVTQATRSGIQDLAIATEATSFYDFHLVEFLSHCASLARYHLRVFRFNPRPVKAFKASLRQRENTDPSDAYTTAEYLRFHLAKAIPYQVQPPSLPLQRLTRFRHHVVLQLTREKSYFLTNLFLQFSTLEKGQPFADVFGATATAVIEELMTPDAIATASPEDLLRFVIAKGNNRFTNPEHLVDELHRLARESSRLSPRLAESVHHVFCLTLANLRALTASLKTLNSPIAKEFATFQTTLPSIPELERSMRPASFRNSGIFDALRQRPKWRR